MSPEQQLILQIQQVLASANIERNDALEDLAMQFAELCESANARLVRCADYIDKGMRSEAVNEMHNSPDLLELSELLLFDEAKKWRNLCIDMEMAVFQPLDIQILEKLKKAAAIERELEPLLRDYRRYVYEGDHRNCILMLRKIREADPDNPSWVANLRPLEEEELPRLVRNAEEALMDDDHVRLKLLYDELTMPLRVVTAPPELMERMRRALLSERAVDLNQEGKVLLEKLRGALAANDGTLTETLLSKMETLTKDDAFIIKPDGWDAAVSEAKDMLALQSRRRERNVDFMKACDSLQELLAHGGYSELELRHEWERLLAWEMPVSDMLRRQVEETLGDIKAKRHRRMRILTGIAVAVLLVVLCGLACFGYLQARAEKEQGAIAHMEELLEAGKYNELDLYIEGLRKTDPRFANTPAVAAKAMKVQEYLRTRSEARDAFDSCMQRLGTIRAREYADATVENIDQLLRDADLEARKLGDKISIDMVRAWRNGWDDWRGRRLAEANEALKSAVAAINSALIERRRKPFTDFDKEDAKLGELRQLVENAKTHAERASEDEREKFADAQERLSGWLREFADRRKASMALNRELEELRMKIPTSIMQFDKYKSLLDRYLAIAPETDPLKAEYKSVLDNFEIYKGAVLRAALPSIVVPPDETGAKTLYGQLANNGAFMGTVWEYDMKSAFAFHRIDRRLRVRLNNLLNENPGLLELYYVNYRRIGEDKWRRLYSARPLVCGPHPNDPNVKIYWGKVFFTSEKDGEPTEMHTKLAFPNYLSTSEFEFKMENKNEDNRCEYAKFLLRLLSDGANAKNMTVYILDAIHQLCEESKIEPVIRALLIKRLVGILADEFSGSQNGALGEMVPEFAAIKGLFSKVSTDVPWMNPDNPNVKASEKALKEAIAQLPDTKQVITRLKIFGMALEAILNSGVHCVGSCVIGTDGLLALDLRGKTISEVWGCFSQTVGAQPYFMVISNDGKHLLKDGVSCHAGMPVFAPAEGCFPNAVLKSSGVTADDLRGVKCPSAWPVNSWK